MTKMFTNFKDYLINAKMDKKNRTLIIFITSLIINILFIGGVYTYISFAYFKPVNAFDKTEIKVMIPRNTSITKIAKELESQGLIRSATVFKYYVDFSDNSSKIRSGTFSLNKSMSMAEITKELSRGGLSESEVSVTISEGMTVDSIAKKLKDVGVIEDEESFKKECDNIDGYLDYEFVAALKGKTTGKKYALEGYLFPDTYIFYTGSSNKDVLTKLLNRFNSIMVPEWDQKADEMGYSIDDIDIIASMIEKEAKTQDFGKVSAVIHNRLKKNQRLQLCSSIHYISGIKRLALTDQDIAVDSPYNTYKNAGLTPSAICNPGKNALNFALNPDEDYVKGGYLFFCNGDPATGQLVFAKTDAEHAANTEKYRALWVEYDKKNAQ
ncbi:MAG: endolytic transglycosylase MltG [Clostridia bacterium]|nr:endolytic transglycosylase MltG [Clostridia bacterium]